MNISIFEKEWDEMSIEEKLNFLRDEIRHFRNAVNNVNFGLHDKIGKVDQKLDGRIRDLEKEVEDLKRTIGANSTA